MIDACILLFPLIIFLFVAHKKVICWKDKFLVVALSIPRLSLQAKSDKSCVAKETEDLKVAFFSCKEVNDEYYNEARSEMWGSIDDFIKKAEIDDRWNFCERNYYRYIVLRRCVLLLTIFLTANLITIKIINLDLYSLSTFAFILIFDSFSLYLFAVCYLKNEKNLETMMYDLVFANLFCFQLIQETYYHHLIKNRFDKADCRSFRVDIFA